MSKLIYQDKTFLQELAEIPEINKVTDNNMNSIKKAVNENGQYVSATESNGEFTCTLEGSISQNDIVHILFDTNSTATPASLSVDGGNTFLNILDASGNSINASELSGQSVSVKNAGSHFEVETLNSYSSSKAKSYSANYVNNVTQANITTDGSAVKCGYQIDGKDVYVKRINFGALPNNTTKTVATGIDFSAHTLIKIEGIAKFATNNIAFAIPFASPATLAYAIMVNIDNSNNLVITTGTDRSSYNAWVNIYYT